MIIVRNLYEAISEMIISLLSSIPFVIIISVIIYWCVEFYGKIRKRQVVGRKKNTIVVLGGYLSSIFQMTIFSRPIGTINEIDIIPFNTPGGTRYIVLYAVANAVIFIPLGILAPIVFDKMKKFPNCVCLGFAISLFIEMSQLVLCCGVVQTEDLIMNTAGTALGYAIYVMFRKLKNKSR